MSGHPSFKLRSMTPGDRAWVKRAMRAEWGAESVAVHGRLYHPAELPGLVAEAANQPVGLLTYSIQDNSCEIVTLNSWRERLGVGTALIEAAFQAALAAKCSRIWLVTTNDNTSALRFYQKRGFVIAAVHVNAVEQDRRLKPEIPLTGLDGIPIRDEIELEAALKRPKGSRRGTTRVPAS